jgi:hypothetical protein
VLDDLRSNDDMTWMKWDDKTRIWSMGWYWSMESKCLILNNGGMTKLGQVSWYDFYNLGCHMISEMQ